MTTLLTNEEMWSIVYSAYMYLEYHAEIEFRNEYITQVCNLLDKITDAPYIWEITKTREDY